MKFIFITILTLFTNSLYSQSVTLKKVENGNQKFWVIIIDKKGETLKSYSPSCYFEDVTTLSDSIKLSLIEQLLGQINNDTSYSYKPVEALSYRYRADIIEILNLQYIIYRLQPLF